MICFGVLHHWQEHPAPEPVVVDVDEHTGGTVQLDIRTCTRCGKTQAFMGEDWYTVEPERRAP